VSSYNISCVTETPSFVVKLLRKDSAKSKTRLSLLAEIIFLSPYFGRSGTTVCVTRAGAGGGTPSDWEKDKA